MPLYAYRCLENNHEFEVRQKFSDDPLTECTICGSPVRRVINQVGVVFKGSGFYVTDNKKANNPAAPSNNGESKGEGSPEGEAKSTSSESSDSAKGESGVPKERKTEKATASKETTTS